METKGKIIELPISEYDGQPIKVLPISRRSQLLDNRKCQRPNFIPRRHDGFNDENEWGESYHEQLRDINRIIRIEIQKKFLDLEIDLDDNYIFTNLTKLIYKSSSKYIPPFS